MSKLTKRKSISRNISHSPENYFDTSDKFDVLTNEEVMNLGKKIKNGDHEAFEKLTKANSRLVIFISKKHQNKGLSIDELIDNGYFGLNKAAERFDGKGIFIYYATWWIHQSIIQALAVHSKMVNLPLSEVSLNKINKIYTDLKQDFEREPSQEELDQLSKEIFEKEESQIREIARNPQTDARYNEIENNSSFDNFEKKSTQFELIKNLKLDRENPRLIEFNISSRTTEQEIMMILYNEMAITELMYSISKNGYWTYEPLIVMPDRDGKFIVLEGSRRLTALKLLLGLELPDDFELPASISSLLNDSLLQSLESIPILVVKDRKEAWKFIGFKHVNGPAKWGSIAKAKFVANVHENFKVPLSDIALQLGDGNSSVQKLYQGLKVLQQADSTGEYPFTEVQAPRIYFSHLYTGIQMRGIKEFIGLNDAKVESQNPVPEEKLKDLGQLLEWLFGRKSEKTFPIIQSQNPDLKHLDEILQHKVATKALRDGESISYALDLTKSESSLFEDSLLDTKKYLQKAKGLVSTGFDGGESLVRIAGQIANSAEDLYSEMYKKFESKSGKKRMT